MGSHTNKTFFIFKISFQLDQPPTPSHSTAACTREGVRLHSQGQEDRIYGSLHHSVLAAR